MKIRDVVKKWAPVVAADLGLDLNNLTFNYSLKPSRNLGTCVSKVYARGFYFIISSSNTITLYLTTITLACLSQRGDRERIIVDVLAHEMRHAYQYMPGKIMMSFENFRELDANSYSENFLKKYYDNETVVA